MSASRSRGLTVALLIGLVSLAATAYAQQDVASVTVTAESTISFDRAVERALRQAVREGAGTFIDSQTKVADFQLIRDAIYSRAAGYVKSHKVLSQQRGLDDTYIVQVFAEVATGAVADDWMAVKNLIELLGRPRFVVTVRQRSGSAHDVEVMATGAVNGYLEETGLGVLHAPTHDESVERQVRRALAAGDTLKAEQLRLQMAAPYGIDIEAFARESQEDVFGNAMAYAVVELQASVVRRDTGDLLASESSVGRAGSFDTNGIRLASQRAVAALFPEVLERILAHWTEDLDVGAAITVQLYDVAYATVSDLCANVRTMEGVRKATIVEAPEGGIARIRVIGRTTAADIADQVPAWTGDRLDAWVEGPVLVTVRRAESAAPVTVEEAPDEPAGLVPVSEGAGQPTVRPRLPVPDVTPSPSYALPAAIVGVCVLLGILLAAVILRRR